MLSGDQYKGYLDHGRDYPIPDPRLLLLYLVVGAVILGVAVVTLFGRTWAALAVYVAAVLIAAVAARRLLLRRREAAARQPHDGHPPPDYR